MLLNSTVDSGPLVEQTCTWCNMLFFFTHPHRYILSLPTLFTHFPNHTYITYTPPHTTLLIQSPFTHPFLPTPSLTHPILTPSWLTLPTLFHHLPSNSLTPSPVTHLPSLHSLTWHSPDTHSPSLSLCKPIRIYTPSFILLSLTQSIFFNGPNNKKFKFTLLHTLSSPHILKSSLLHLLPQLFHSLHTSSPLQHPVPMALSLWCRSCMPHLVGITYLLPAVQG